MHYFLLAAARHDHAQVGTGDPPAEPAPSSSIDLGGRLVLPELHDAHLHVYMLGACSAQVG